MSPLFSPPLRWGLAVLIALSSLVVVSPSRADGCLGVVDGGGCRHGLPADQYNGLLAQMQANPEPSVSQIGVSGGELQRWSFWRLASTDVTIYNAPNGKAIGKTNPGFAFVLAYRKTDDWMEIEPDKWIKRTDLTATYASGHTGVLLSGEMPFQMAWILRPTRASAIPGAKADPANPVLKQYQRVYIYHAVTVGTYEWFLVGPGQWVMQLNLGRVTFIAPPGGANGRWVSIDLYEQILVAYEGGTPIFATPISSGLRSFPTREGLFSVWAKMATDDMSGSMGLPDQYSIPRVPYVLYFDGDRALHGAFWHNSFGYQKSHGCVNMSVGDAKWVYDFLGEGSSVYVFRSR